MTRGAGRPLLALVFETPEVCQARLVAQGFAPVHAREIASYLDQATDLAPEFEAIGAACAAHGLDFRPVPLDAAPAIAAELDRARSLVWTLTDGISYFRGSAAPALARLHGLPIFGADDALFALCQDKFRSGAVLAALGLPVPRSGLARDGSWLVPPPPDATLGYFVKPNRLGAKIGIWEDSHCRTPAEALALSRRIFAAYRDDALVQAYVPGRNVRASFLAVEPGSTRLGLSLVETRGDFQTMAESLALFGETGASAAAQGRRQEPALDALDAVQPAAAALIRSHAGQLMDALGLRDVFSLDWRVEVDDTVHLLEFEVCPGLPCFDFRAYCRDAWGLGLPEAMAGAAARRLAPTPA